MKSSRKVSTTWLLLVLTLCLFTTGEGTTVLCLGSDGHVRVEFLLDADCGRATRAGTAMVSILPSGPGQFRSPAGDDCGPCTDIPLSIRDVAHRDPSPQFAPLAPKQPVLSAIVPPEDAATESSGAAGDFENTPPVFSILSKLSSVFLLL